jgi:hypothetical protein
MNLRSSTKRDQLRIPGRPNPGKDYYEYREEEEKRNGAKRKARMDAALAAKRAREAAGVDISIVSSDAPRPL